MSKSDRHQRPKSRWSAAGRIIVALTVALVGFAIYFAIGQSRGLALLRIADAQREALQLRLSATGSIRLAAGRMLDHAIERFESGDREDPFDGGRGAGWLAEVYIWDGQRLTWWGAKDDGGTLCDPDPGLNALIAARLKHRLDDAKPTGRTVIPFITDTFRGRSIVLAVRAGSLGTDRAILAAVQLDLRRLREDYLDRHFAASGNLSIVEDLKGRHAHWATPLSDALPLLIVPSQPFIEAELNAAFVRIAVFVAIGVLFLVVIVALIVKMMRLVQREVALAQLKSNFVADVSHELKTPLALIRMFSEMLTENRVPSDEKKLEYYGIINRESTRLTQLIENILDFSRIEAGRKAYAMRPIDVGCVIGDTYDNYRADLDQRGFQHSLDVADGLPTVDADADAIAQAVVNLMGNAVKYSRDEKRIDIDIGCETRRDRHGVLISVADSGIGISPEDRARMFDGFFRANDDRVRKVRGTGLGLSVVKHIVEAHHGSIDVESRLVKGTVFRIFLPESTTIADGDS